ncbi:MAG: queuosine precursor transporter [Tannerellaceae bacterium]
MESFRYRETIKSERLWGILLALYCACLIISNVLASKVFALGPFTLPCGVILFPVVYILNDVLAEVYPLAKVRKGIFMGFGLNLLAVICFEIAVILPGYGDNIFGQLLGSSWRVLLASFVAYLVGSSINAQIMNHMHTRDGEKRLFWRCVASTLIGETLDAFLFCTIAFVGLMPMKVLFIMVASQAVIKTLYEIVVFPATRKVIQKVKTDLA